MTSNLCLLALLGLVTSGLANPQYGGQQKDVKETDFICREGFDCVPWQTCIAGYIDASGGSGLDQRSQPQKPQNYETDKCGQDEHMCCAFPTDIWDIIRGETGIDGYTGIVGGIDIIENQCGHANYDCVPYFQCIDGEINTDGSGLIDIRIRPRGVCVNSEYPDVPAVCCLIPGAEPTPTPVETCPGYKECVPFSMCSAGGDVITDGTGVIDIRTGYTSCYLDSGIGGICCNPPQPYVDTCPGKSICSSGYDCLGQALDASNSFIDYISSGRWTTCSYGSEDGVCCIPPPPKIIDYCPGDSVCLLPSKCKGEAMNDLDIFVSYINEGSWTHCSAYDQGVCCINPAVKEILRPAKHCGVRNYDIASRITSLNEAKFGEFPWQSIIFYQNYTYNCGATLISNKHVLTAAHCIDGLLASDIRIRFGEWQVNSFDEPLPYMDRNVYAIYIHPKFNPRNVHNDIAVMELLEPIEFQYHINAACLPSHRQIFDAYTPCIATGWGKDSFQGSFQHILKKIDLPFIDHDTCQNYLRKTRLGKYFRLDQSFVCAGGEENKDACYGDGGGPLVCKDPASGQYFVAGITSWGIGCGTKDVPGVYADVQQFSVWLQEIVRGNSNIEKEHQQQKDQEVPGYGK